MYRSFAGPLLSMVLAVSATAFAWAEQPSKRLLLLGQGPDGHKVTTHEYMAGVKLLQLMLAKVDGLETRVVNADEPFTEGPDLLQDADGVVIFLSEGAKWLHQDPRRLQAFGKLAERGGGCVALHWAMGTREARNIEGFVKVFGGCHGGPDRRYKVVPDAKVSVVNGKHPICTGIGNFTVRDEFYYKLKFVNGGKNITPILKTNIEGNAETVAWAWQREDKGRSFGFSGLHFHDNWSRAEYRRLVAQAILWSLKMPVPQDGLNVDLSKQDLQLPSSKQ